MAFVFTDYSWNEAKSELSLLYQGGGINFREKIQFPKTSRSLNSAEKHALDQAFFALWIMAGVSYFKAFIPSKIKLSHDLDSWQKYFFEKIYTAGLGEFFYTHQISPQDQVIFPSSMKNFAKKSVPLQHLKGDLLSLGGGKDSLVSAFLLDQQGVGYDLFTIGDNPIFQMTEKKLKKKRIIIHREIDSQLFNLNEQGAPNGHVPISLINMFISVASLIITGKKFAIFSNESSASEPNTQYKGFEINHQYSKSIEAEKFFQEYIDRYISPSICVYSLLRTYSELDIVEIFARNLLDDFGDIFASCNTNFKLHQKTKTKWCESCPKCVFIALALSAYISYEQFSRIFTDNIFSEKNYDLLKKLLGLKDFKPFECVGTTAECQKAFWLAHDSNEYEDLKNFAKIFSVKKPTKLIKGQT